jgi:peptidoglycan/xylan/chitin deacetylase (PgdA/CDA1 family)
MRTSLVRVALAVSVVAAAAAASPAPSAAVTPSPAAPMQVTFEAGTHVGYTFTSSGAVTSTKSATLPRPSGASTTRRAYITGRGNFLLISNGIWAGYYVRESLVAHVKGQVADVTYSPVRRVTFPAGTIIGYRFDTAWNLTSAKIGTLGHSSGADASRLAVINGTAYYQIVNGGWANTWVPVGGTNLTRALACHTGPRATGGSQVIRQVVGAGPEIALTFDLGGRVDPAMDIMRYLLLTGTCSTIFPTGANGQTVVGSQVLATIKAYPQLFEVANHTMYHCNLVTGGGGGSCPAGPPTTARIQKELTDAAAVIKAGSGQDPIPYWRPPYGAYNGTVQSAASAIGYTKNLMWDIDTIDWRAVADGGPTAPAMTSKVVTNARNGSIVLMHLGGWNTRNALPSMIHGLRATRGLTTTTVSDLLDLE